MVADTSGHKQPATHTIQSEGGRAPSTPNGPHGPLRSKQSAEVADTHSTDPDAGGAARGSAPPASGNEEQ
eukprot:3748246-Alexandrium_andersonii.AAC.1